MKDIMRLLGVKRTAMQQWIDRGYLAPSIEKAAGHGTRNVWSRKDMFRIAAFQELLAHGFSRDEAADLLNTSETLVISDRGVELPGKGVPKIEAQVLFGTATYAFHVEDAEGRVINSLVVAMNEERGAEALAKFVAHEGIVSIRSLRAVNLTEAIRKIHSQM